MWSAEDVIPVLNQLGTKSWSRIWEWRSLDWGEWSVSLTCSPRSGRALWIQTQKRRDDTAIRFKPTQSLSSETYCNGFAQSVSRQRLGKHVPTCNNGRCVPIDECYGSFLGNSQRAKELVDSESRDLCFLCCPCGAYITKTCRSLDWSPIKRKEHPLCK
jgi:hypothetical protein